MILDETRERFLIAIAKQVDPARIAEIHFFAPIRQGGVESGVAVIAAAARAEAAPEAAPEAAAVESPGEEASAEPVADQEADSAAVEAPPSAGGDLSEASPPQDDTVSPPDESVSLEVESVSLEEGSTAALEDDSIAAQSDGIAAQDDAAVSAPIERHVIYTARYRLTLKGPDRGKWETNVTAEADAPIITVDAVVRGVQRRAGDVDDPTRMNGDEVRAALPAA